MNASGRTVQLPKSLEATLLQKQEAARAILRSLGFNRDMKVSAAYQKRTNEMLFRNLNRMSWEALDWLRFAVLVEKEQSK